MSLKDGRRLLWRHLAPQRVALLRLTAWSALEALPTFFSGLLVAGALDRGFLAGRPLVGFGWLAALAALWVAGAFGTRQVFPWLAAVVEPLRDSLVTVVITASLRRALRDQDTDGGSSITQATVQVESVRALVATLLRTTRQLLASVVAAIAGLAVLSPLLALVVGGFAVLAVLVFMVLLRTLVDRDRRAVLCEERITAVASPLVEGMRDVVVSAAEGRAAQQVGRAIDAQAEASRAYALADALRLPVVTLGAHLPLLALLALSPWLLARGQLGAGQIVGAVVYLVTVLQPAIQVLVNAGGTVLVNLGVILARLAEVSAERPPAPPAPRWTLPGHHLAAEHVTFAYSAHAEPVIRDLTLDLPEGIHLAVVGPSGVGKSTLANLLARLATPQRGELRLGGQPLDDVGDRYLRRTIALIPQEAYVFAGTVRDNLAYLRPTATDTELRRAVAAVGLEETITLLGGYRAEIAPGGGGLSPGERQLIALARTYLSPAAVIILDEATCHLDPVAEARAEQAFAERHGTLVVVAHRISSAMRADRILVMDGADAVLGSHRELLATSSLYADLVGYWDSTASERVTEATA